jgi:phosphoadenosine phosphosulfate reductase
MNACSDKTQQRPLPVSAPGRYTEAVVGKQFEASRGAAAARSPPARAFAFAGRSRLEPAWFFLGSGGLEFSVMALLTQADLGQLNDSFEERTPAELLRWVTAMFGKRAAIMSAMQRAGTVLCHMAYREKIDLDVLFVDTGVMFQETLDTRDRLIREYGLNVITLQPPQSMADQTRQYGVLYLTPEGQEQCCEMRKTAPLMTVVGQYDALVQALRREDGDQRSKVPILSVDPRMNALRVNILANFGREKIEAYVAEHNVIINPLHKQGYSTIGCNRCTTPVLPGEPKRAGRWRHLGPWAMYCGINPTDSKKANAQAIELPQDLIDKILGRKTDFAI